MSSGQSFTCSINVRITFLCADDLFEVVVRIAEEFPQPFFAADGPGEIQFMKNGEFFLCVKDGYVVERCFSICMSG